MVIYLAACVRLGLRSSGQTPMKQYGMPDAEHAGRGPGSLIAIVNLATQIEGHFAAIQINDAR